MSTPTSSELLGITEYAALVEDEPSELVRGRLVREPWPSIAHGWLQARFAQMLGAHIDAERLGLVCFTDASVITSEDPPTVRAPDVGVVLRERVDSLHETGWLRGAPDLSVEIVSPSNRASEIQEKVLEYLRAGASIVWVVYPNTRTVAVHETQGGARYVGEGEHLDGGDLMPGLQVSVAELFRG